MPTINEITKHIEKFAPKDLARPSDNVGLLVGDGRRAVSRVMIMLDADRRTIDEAVEFGANLIITHHPFLYAPIKSINDEKLLKLIENKIALYSAHTNIDSANGGVNDIFAKKLQLGNTEEITIDGLITRIGETAECSFREYIELVKSRLGIKNARYTGDLNKRISKIGILGGSGGDLAGAIKDAGCDVYVTADVKYHQAQFADEVGLCVIDAGHFETENFICPVLRDYISKEFDNLEVVVSKRNESYIGYL